MLLTIHNLPSNMRYNDVKSLISEKCGLTEIILDNLVNEGKGKKVTVGLANEDDGALVVRKINGLYLHGQQIYIEDKRRKTDVHSQPYRSSTSLIPETRNPELDHSNSMMSSVAVPNVAMAWNYNMATTPYMVMPVDQSFAYPSYGGAPQAMQYMEPQSVVPAATDRGFQGEDYARGNRSRDPEPVAFDRPGREQASGPFRQQDRKRYHSPEKLQAAKKKASRWAEMETPRRREVSPPRQQRPQERDQGPRPPFREPEQYARNQKQYQPREPKPDNQRSDPQWEPRPRWEDSNPRSEREREWGNDNNRDWEPKTDKVWSDKRNPQWRDEPRPWENDPNPQWDDQPNPHWEGNSRMPMEEVRSEWYDRHSADRNPPDDFPPRERMPERGFSREFEPRQRDNDFNGRHQNEKNAPGNWNRDASPRNIVVSRSDDYSNRHIRREDEMPRRDRPRPNNAHQGRDRRGDSPRSPRAPSGEERENTDYWGEVADDYPVSRRPEFETRDAPNVSRQDKAPRNNAYDAPRNDRKSTNRPDAPKRPVSREEKRYPPVDDRRLPPQRKVEPRFENSAPIPKKPLSVTAAINKDQTTRGQATAVIAKRIIGMPVGTSSYLPGSALDGYVFKQLKLCIRTRIDVMLGEKLVSDYDDVIRRYRLKYPASGDRPLLKQIREKSATEYREKQEKLAEEREQRAKQVKDQINIKKETDETKNQEDNAVAPAEAIPEIPKEVDTEPKNKPAGRAPAIPMPVQLPKLQTKGNKPLTDKQKIKEMKLQRKFEYSQDGVYNLDPVTDKALGDELAELDTLFIEECAKSDDPQEEVISKHITTESLNDFNKTTRLYITKRFLNIETGLAVRIFSAGKLPKRVAIEEYLKSRKIQNPVFKKSVKGTMFVVNLCRFQDFDKLCSLEQDVIDGTPVNFKAMHLAGPPVKIKRDQTKLMRQQRINSQIDKDIALPHPPKKNTGDFTGEMEGNFNPEDFEEAEEYSEQIENVNPEQLEEAEQYTEQIDNVNPEDFEEADEYTDQIEETSNTEDFQEKEDFAENVNIGALNEDDLEDF